MNEYQSNEQAIRENDVFFRRGKREWDCFPSMSDAQKKISVRQKGKSGELIIICRNAALHPFLAQSNENRKNKRIIKSAKREIQPWGKMVVTKGPDEMVEIESMKLKQN